MLQQYGVLKAAYHELIVPKLLLRCRSSGYWQQKHDIEIGGGSGEYVPSLEVSLAKRCVPA